MENNKRPLKKEEKKVLQKTFNLSSSSQKIYDFFGKEDFKSPFSDINEYEKYHENKKTRGTAEKKLEEYNEIKKGLKILSQKNVNFSDISLGSFLATTLGLNQNKSNFSEKCQWLGFSSSEISTIKNNIIELDGSLTLKEKKQINSDKKLLEKVSECSIY